MSRFRKIRGTASLVAQLLGLGIAILLLTNAGRYAVARFGLLEVLAVALGVFVVAEISIVMAVLRFQTRSAAASPLPAPAAPVEPGQGAESQPQ